MPSYIAVIHKEHESDYGVSFPDFPGCISAAATIDDAKDLAHEALSLHIRGMIEDSEPIPPASDLEDIMNDNPDARAFFVVSIPDHPRIVRINITIPEDSLKKIDAAAKRQGMSRSSFLTHHALKGS